MNYEVHEELLNLCLSTTYQFGKDLSLKLLNYIQSHPNETFYFAQTLSPKTIQSFCDKYKFSYEDHNIEDEERFLTDRYNGLINKSYFFDFQEINSTNLKGHIPLLETHFKYQAVGALYYRVRKQSSDYYNKCIEFYKNGVDYYYSNYDALYKTNFLPRVVFELLPMHVSDLYLAQKDFVAAIDVCETAMAKSFIKDKNAYKSEILRIKQKQEKAQK